MNRREFIKRTGGLGASLWGTFNLGEEIFAQTRTSRRGTSKVVIAGDANVWAGESLNPVVVQELINKGICALTGKRQPKEAWRSIFSPQDVVGIKVNCIAPGMATNPQTVYAVVNGLKEAGVPENNIIIYERSDSELIKCGFKINRSSSGVRCYQTPGYDAPVNLGSVTTQLSTILTKEITALINMPVLKHHRGAGVTLSMKNHFGSIRNPSELHPNNCDPYIAQLNAHPVIKNKTRLIICDAWKGQYDRGAGNAPECQWKYSCILLSQDPVALDAVGRDILQRARKAVGLQPIRNAIHVDTAAKYGLGTNDLRRIEMISVTLKG